MRWLSVAVVRGLASRMWVFSGMTLPSWSLPYCGVSISLPPSSGDDRLRPPGAVRDVSAHVEGCVGVTADHAGFLQVAGAREQAA
jgi:hypothetical protein